VLQFLRPELFADPAVSFIVHPVALTGTFGEILSAFGIPSNRLLPLDLTTAHIVEEATLVSFCDQELIYPAVMQAFAAYVRQALGITRRAGPGRRVFASRQGQSRPRRRVKNWDEAAVLLKSLSFDICSFGELPASEQIQIYTDADVVVGVHGSDLSSLMFCRPGTKVLVFETRRNIDLGLHFLLQWLCKLFDLDYTCHMVEQIEAESSEPTEEMRLFNRDVILDRTALDAIRACFPDSEAHLNR
jgi:capsular polysaccharide biosynthesis protein